MSEEVIEGEVVSDDTAFTRYAGSPFGWCNDGLHAPTDDGRTKGCPGTIPEREWPDPARKGTTYTIPARRCPCACHRRDLD